MPKSTGRRLLTWSGFFSTLLLLVTIAALSIVAFPSIPSVPSGVSPRRERQAVAGRGDFYRLGVPSAVGSAVGAQGSAQMVAGANATENVWVNDARVFLQEVLIFAKQPQRVELLNRLPIRIVADERKPAGLLFDSIAWYSIPMREVTISRRQLAGIGRAYFELPLILAHELDHAELDNTPTSDLVTVFEREQRAHSWEAQVADWTLAYLQAQGWAEQSQYRAVYPVWEALVEMSRDDAQLQASVYQLRRVLYLFIAQIDQNMDSEAWRDRFSEVDRSNVRIFGSQLVEVVQKQELSDEELLSLPGSVAWLEVTFLNRQVLSPEMSALLREASRLRQQVVQESERVKASAAKVARLMPK